MSKRVQAKGFFLTYPQCSLTKEQCLELLKSLPIKTLISEYLVCEEKHEDGSPHLHVFLKYEKKILFKPNLWDISTFHGHYEVSKSAKSVIQYCTKDGNYISNFNVDAIKSHQPKKISKEDFLLDPLDLIDSGVLKPMQLKAFVQNQALFKMLNRKREHPDLSELPCEKKRHPWIYGPSNCGKTTRMKQMLEEFGRDNCFQIPYNNDWSGYQGERILYCDEFKGQLTVQDLNRICDGDAKLNTKGGTIQLHPLPQVCIVSNFSISQCFSHVPS